MPGEKPKTTHDRLSTVFTSDWTGGGRNRPTGVRLRAARRSSLTRRVCVTEIRERSRFLTCDCDPSLGLERGRHRVRQHCTALGQRSTLVFCLLSFCVRRCWQLTSPGPSSAGAGSPTRLHGGCQEGNAATTTAPADLIRLGMRVSGAFFALLCCCLERWPKNTQRPPPNNEALSTRRLCLSNGN